MFRIVDEALLHVGRPEESRELQVTIQNDVLPPYSSAWTSSIQVHPPPQVAVLGFQCEKSASSVEEALTLYLKAISFRYDSHLRLYL